MRSYLFSMKVSPRSAKAALSYDMLKPIIWKYEHSVLQCINPLPDDKISHWSNLNKLQMTA